MNSSANIVCAANTQRTIIYLEDLSFYFFHTWPATMQSSQWALTPSSALTEIKKSSATFCSFKALIDRLSKVCPDITNHKEQITFVKSQLGHNYHLTKNNDLISFLNYD